MDKIIEGKIRIIYKNHKPHGIRDDTGFLFFFCEVHKYTNQEERYRKEIEQQFSLADSLKDFLQSREPGKKEVG